MKYEKALQYDMSLRTPLLQCTPQWREGERDFHHTNSMLWTTHKSIQAGLSSRFREYRVQLYYIRHATQEQRFPDNLSLL